MDINYTFGRFWALLLPIALLVVFFKYLHQLNSILTSIEGVGFRKTLLTLFVAFFAIWSLVYFGSVFFVRAISWALHGTNPIIPTQRPNLTAQQDLEKPLNNSMDYNSIKEGESLFKLALKDESAA